MTLGRVERGILGKRNRLDLNESGFAIVVKPYVLVKHRRRPVFKLNEVIHYVDVADYRRRY